MIVSAGGLGVSFGSDEVFSKLTFNIERGDRTALVGVNGAGKTTLFRVLVGALEPSEGTVTRARGIRVGYLPQEMSEFPSGPLLERVALHSGEIREALDRQAALHEDLASGAGEDEAVLRDLEATVSLLECADVYNLENRAARLLGGLGFRPEAVRIGPGPVNTLTTRIRSVTYLGEVEQYLLALEDGTPLKAVEQNPLEIRRPGVALTVHVRPEDVFVLPRAA